MTTLRERILEVTPVGREFTTADLTDELFPQFKHGSSDWIAKRIKIASLINTLAKFGTFCEVEVLKTSGRPVLWRRCEE